MYKLNMERPHVRWLLIFCLLALLLSSIVQAETKKLIDLDFKAADIKDILRALAAQAGVTFLIDNDVTATVTLHLSGKTFTEALNIITKNNNLAVTKEESVYHISQIDTSVLKIEYENGLLSVEARGAKLLSLFDTITQKTGENLILDPQILDRGSIILNKVPLEDAIKALLTQFNLVGKKNGKVTNITRNILPGGDGVTKIEYQNGLLTIDAKSIPLQTLTRSITEKTNTSIVPDNGLNPNVSIFVQNLAISDALTALCDTNNLGLSKDGSVYRIYKLNNSFRVSYKNNTLSVDADGADAEGLFSEISRQSGVQITLDRDLRAQVNIHFKSVSLSQGIVSIADSVGWMIEKRGSAYQLRFNTNNNPNIRIFYNPETKLFDIDVQSAALAQVINEIAKKADLNISVSSQVNWSVNSVRLIQVSVYQVFDFLLEGTIFTYRELDGVFIFSDSMYPRPETVDFVETHVYQIKYLKSDQVMNTLPATFPRQDFMNIPEKNSLIVTGPPNVHTLFADYLEKIDVEGIEDRTEVIRIRHLKAEDVLKYLPNSIPKQDIIVIKEMNAITVSGPQNTMNQIKQYIDKIDQPNPMIVFDVKVIKISDSNTLDWSPPTVNGIGVDFTKPGILPLPINGTGAITQIDALISKGKAKVLQNPIITTLNGYPTSFTVSSKRTYLITSSSTTDTSGGGPTPTAAASSSTKTVDNSLTISLTPWVSANDQITMEIKPRITEYGPVSGDKNVPVPDTSEHSTETTVRVNNKQTVVISGLKSTRKEKSVSKIPGLGDVPLLGFFFRQSKDIEVEDEFVIIITPTLVYDDYSQADANQIIKDTLGPAMNGIDTSPTPTVALTSIPSSTATGTPTPLLAQISVPTVTPTPTPVPSPTVTVTPTPTPVRKLTSSAVKMGSKNNPLNLGWRLFSKLPFITFYLKRINTLLSLFPVILKL